MVFICSSIKEVVLYFYNIFIFCMPQAETPMGQPQIHLAELSQPEFKKDERINDKYIILLQKVICEKIKEFFETKGRHYSLRRISQEYVTAGLNDLFRNSIRNANSDSFFPDRKDSINTIKESIIKIGDVDLSTDEKTKATLSSELMKKLANDWIELFNDRLLETFENVEEDESSPHTASAA